ncbi:hypothetical protein HMPREF1150_1066 [Streptococcus sp. AS14]|uniref:hypothetical protein n=1 Tax=Streptococcus TaxID=1301 RepID=UPI0002780E90|nr:MULTISPECIES: hypothetical protein [Streptococcus]EJO17902.1 hypothetical protein HMPREF1150_1066 [Streptococcus sp. AS14]MBF1722667.1 hypothetical protein [Streptococcus sp.]MCY7027422.1 hypothetical protein [Streptococcus sanguinis]
MEYKRSYAGEVVGIIAIIIGAFIAVATIQSPPRTGDSYNDRLEQLNSEMKEERLNESPMTIEKAKLMFGSDFAPENETPEEERERLQSLVDSYNKQLESEQASIRREKESEQEIINQNNQYIAPILIGAGVFITILVISAFTKANEPSALTISDDKIDIKATVFREMKHIDLERIKQIQYKIKVYRTNKSRRTYRILYFKDENGNILEELDLDNLAGADFNTIHREISNRAPHIEWIFPE